MVVLKRKPGVKESYTYSTVEIKEPKSFNDVQNSITIDEDTEVFSGRKHTKDYEIHPEIKKEHKAQTVKKEAVSSKTKVILVAYLAVAVILTAIVIATGIAVGNAQSRVSKLQTQIIAAESFMATQEDDIMLFSDPDKIRGTAMGPDYQMEYVNGVIEIPLIKLTEPVSYEKSTNWFNAICEFFSKIFS